MNVICGGCKGTGKRGKVVCWTCHGRGNLGPKHIDDLVIDSAQAKRGVRPIPKTGKH